MPTSSAFALRGVPLVDGGFGRRFEISADRLVVLGVEIRQRNANGPRRAVEARAVQENAAAAACDAEHDVERLVMRLDVRDEFIAERFLSPRLEVEVDVIADAQ